MVVSASSSASATEMVENATRGDPRSPDWTTISAICESINSNQEQAKDIVEAVGERLHHDNRDVQLLTLKLLDAIVSNCDNDFVHSQIVEKKIVEKMIQIVKEKADIEVTKVILVLLYSWNEAFGGESILPSLRAKYGAIVSGTSGPSDASGASAAPVSVIGTRYCKSSTVELEISREAESTLNFVVRDAGGEIFKVQQEGGIIRSVVLVDGPDTVVRIKKQIPSLHGRRVVSNGKGNSIFSVRRSEVTGEKTKLDVFLAGNKEEKDIDFRMEKSGSENLLVIYRGKSSSTRVAEMHKEADKDKTVVKIDPNIDIAFIVTLVVIYEWIIGKKRQKYLRRAGAAAVKCAALWGLHELLEFLMNLSG